MKLGAFSVSLNVADLQKSKKFYEALGFSEFGGNLEYNYLIMKNNDVLIGLFQNMFEKNMLTFNPGWDQNGQNLDEFDDIRNLKETLRSKGVEFTQETGDIAAGPASFVVMDPDGNPVLIDQHRS